MLARGSWATTVGLATHVFGTSRLHRTPRDPYTVGKSVVGSFQHCMRPPHTRTQTGDTRTDTRALPACQRCRRVPQARASATHASLLLHTIETSAPAASRRYADAAQRPTLARVVKSPAAQDASAGRWHPLGKSCQHLHPMRRAPTLGARCSRLQHLVVQLSLLVAAFRPDALRSHTRVEHRHMSETAHTRRENIGSDGGSMLAVTVQHTQMLSA